MADQTLLPDHLVAERYSIHPKTLQRWDATPALEFPRPTRIRGRRYRSIAELDAWDKAAIERRVRGVRSKSAAAA
jgi:hypothetical protein